MPLVWPLDLTSHYRTGVEEKFSSAPAWQWEVGSRSQTRMPQVYLIPVLTCGGMDMQYVDLWFFMLANLLLKMTDKGAVVPPWALEAQLGESESSSRGLLYFLVLSLVTLCTRHLLTIPLVTCKQVIQGPSHLPALIPFWNESKPQDESASATGSKLPFPRLQCT